MCKRVLDFPPAYVNLTICLLGAKEPQTTTKKHNTQNKSTYTLANVQI